MELTWWVVVIAGCVGLALCIAAVVLRAMHAERRRLRPLAHVSRLTSLPEYRRADHLRTISAVASIFLLVVVFTAAVIAGARPKGLPSAAEESAAAQPEDIMLCMGGPLTDPAAGATLQYFGGQVRGFTTQRIGLTSPNRRVVPLTRDYQYAAAQFDGYAQPAEQRGDVEHWSPTVSYVDYAGGVEDVLAMCLTGFPSFDQPAAQRRSLIYVGPDSLPETDDTGPELFTADRVRHLATTAGVQVNVVVTGPHGDALDALARETGGRSFSAGSAVTAQLSEIRDHQPPPTATAVEAAATRSTESPDVPLMMALAALAALALLPTVMRR